MTITPAGRGPQLVALYSFFVALTTITVALRAYCRIYVQKAFGWDDYFTVASWAFFVMFASFAITGAHHGTGQHVGDIPADELPLGLKFWWLCEPFYLMSNMFIKASIGIMLLRLCVNKIHQSIVWTTLIITELYSAMFFFIFLFQCLPSSYFWTQYANPDAGSCMDPFIVVAVFYGYSAVSCAGDWTYSILPVFLVWDLQMGRREKLSVIMILAVGALASIATIARIPYVHTLSQVDDFLYATFDVALWSCVETALGITAASCATLRPLLRRIMPSLGFTTSNSRSRGGLSQSGLAQSGKHNNRSTRGPYERSSSRSEEDEMKLQGLEHARGKEFGTLTSAWHPEDREDRDVEVGSNNSDTMIINTKTSVYYHTEEDTHTAPRQQPRQI